MVHSNGTRFESQRFKIDRTGSKKYSGHSAEFRCVFAAGELAASRAMPTSGARASAGNIAAASRVRSSDWRGAPSTNEFAGGQSGEGQPERLPLEPVAIGARSAPVQACGPGASGQAGNSEACGTRGRRLRRAGAGLERTGDMAHLTTRRYSLFVRLMSSLFFVFYSPGQHGPLVQNACCRPRNSPCNPSGTAQQSSLSSPYRLNRRTPAGKRPTNSQFRRPEGNGGSP